RPRRGRGYRYRRAQRDEGAGQGASTSADRLLCRRPEGGAVATRRQGRRVPAYGGQGVVGRIDLHLPGPRRQLLPNHRVQAGGVGWRFASSPALLQLLKVPPGLATSMERSWAFP